jgi:hypothetical protein
MKQTKALDGALTLNATA